MQQMRSYLDRAMPLLVSDQPEQSDVTYSSLPRGVDSRSDSFKPQSLRRTASTGQKPLSRWQENYYLDLFWQSYHCLYPILKENEFMALHNSLWSTPYEPRKSSALVDIVLALCLQYGTALPLPDPTSAGVNAEERGKDAATAGKSLYRRCQGFLQEDDENPSITTLQCRIFSVIYLHNAGSHNAAHNMLALACRNGIILGLHREPMNIGEDEKDFQRRLWWTVYALEMKAAMDFGRPLAINLSQVTSALPADAPKIGSVSIPGQAMAPEISSCFSSNLQLAKLSLAARSVYVMFYDKCAELLGPSHYNSLHEDSQALETCARFLAVKMEHLKTWVREVPEALKAKRRNGESLSTGGSALYMQPTISFVQQRQQMFLELHYHTMSMNLYRPFICFPSSSSLSETLSVDENAIACLEHAITVTDIIHQLMTETDILHGWLESLQWHGSAFLSLVGYVVAYPAGKCVRKARETMRKALSTIGIFSKSLAVADSFVDFAHDLAAKAEMLADRAEVMGPNPKSIPNVLLSRDVLTTESSILMSPGKSYIASPSGKEGWSLEPSEAAEMGRFDNESLSAELNFPFDFTGGMDWVSSYNNDSALEFSIGEEFDVDFMIS
jgi:hypothetical protein